VFVQIKFRGSYYFFYVVEMSSSGFSTDLGMSNSPVSSTDKGQAEELQEFMYMEQQKAQLRSQIQVLTDVCWEKCVDKPQPKLDTKTESCLENCAARFVDVTLLITNRFTQVLQRASGMQ